MKSVQLAGLVRGTEYMNSSLSLVGKLLLAAVLVLIIAHFWPGLAAIAFVGVGGVLAAGGALAAGVGGLLTLVVGAAVGVAVLAIVLGIALAPLWLPVLAIVGLVAIVRSLSRPTA